ncbi:MAG TPA: YfjP family GTPase [Streptosporangiaceae bacterium]
MSARRQATADRGWFRLRTGTATEEPPGPDETAAPGGNEVAARPVPLAAPTPAAAGPGTSSDVTTGPGSAGGKEDGAAGLAGDADGSAAGAGGAGRSEDAEAEQPPDAPTMTRPAPWVHFGGPRRGTARTRAAQADLAARSSAIAPPPPPPPPFPVAEPPQPGPPGPPGQPEPPGPPEPPASAGPAEAEARPEAEAGPELPQPRTVSLSARLMALARMIQIGSARSSRDGFGRPLLADAEDVLARAGERMRLSSGHTVVVLAGGTGSGKSSLFNRLAGADLSTVGVTRPVTKDAHACVWGEQGSGPILEWLKVPRRYRYSRASALDSGEQDLAGLVLLDLPDHDSVMSHAGELVDQLVGMADVMVWVLDPQKYADAAVHRRFLVPLAGHSAVVAVVLNQVDLLDPAQVDDCVADLRRLLDSENLHDVPIVVTSAATGAGLDDLRELLGRGIAARRAAAARISADLDSVVSRFLPFAGDVGSGQEAPADDDLPATALADNVMTGRTTAGSSASSGKEGAAGAGVASSSAGARLSQDVPSAARQRLAGRFAAAAGVAAIGEALRSARELRAVDFVGWPVAWFFQRLTGRDPARKVRIGALWSDLRAVTAGPAGAQQAEIDNALTEFGNELAGSLPKPWPAAIKSAVRSQAQEIPAAIGTAIGEALPAEDSVVWWWRLAGLGQGLLLGAAAVAIAWSLLIAVVRLVHGQASMPGLMSDLAAVPWLVLAAILALALGAAMTWLCMKAVVTAAERESVEMTAELRERIAGVAQDMVIAEAERELAEFLRYREEARIAASGMALDPIG